MELAVTRPLYIDFEVRLFKRDFDFEVRLFKRDFDFEVRLFKRDL